MTGSPEATASSCGRRVATAAALLASWNLLGYPLVLLAAARLRQPFRPAPSLTFRRITVMIAAHDEEAVIGARVANLLADRPALPLEIIVVADGCTDATAERARAAGATVIEQPRQGKIAALHRAAEAAAGDVLVLTDANTRFAPGAVEALVAPLADPRVGIAAGDLRYENAADSSATGGENLYWRYETAIKRAASRTGLLLMGAGGIYAMRREDWPFSLPNDLADDSYVPLSLHRAGRVNLLVEEAVAWERAGATMPEEWRRRVRMVAQDVRVAAALAWGLPNSRTCFALVSQKGLRWLLLPLGLLAAAPILRSRRLILAVIALGAGGLAAPAGRRFAGHAAYLLGATAAAFAGFCLGLAGRSPAVWKKAESTRPGTARGEPA